MASTVRGIVSRQQALWMRTAAAPVSVTRRALSNWYDAGGGRGGEDLKGTECLPSREESLRAFCTND